jgi:hypothetical protein
MVLVGRKSRKEIAMLKKSSILAILVIPCFLCRPCPAWAQAGGPRLVLVKQVPRPVLSIHSLGAEANKYGFEAGQVVKLGKTYHLVITELFGDPYWVKTKLGHWASEDGIHWERVSTLFASSGEFEGKDPRAALWAPAVAYDEKAGRWNLFYVAYRAQPNRLHQWRHLYEARIWRAISRAPGLDGLDGPYDDAGVILEPGPDSDKWEGLQGVDSFFPYQVGDQWYGFYGSCNTETGTNGPWRVGLASAPELAGPWKRLSSLNPVEIQKPFVEVPIVTRLSDGTYLAVYDSEDLGSVGYTFSSDGVHWSRGNRLMVQPKGQGYWADGVRTPLCLIPEGNETYTLFYTGNQHVKSIFPDVVQPGDSAMGMVTVKLLRPGKSTPP